MTIFSKLLEERRRKKSELYLSNYQQCIHNYSWQKKRYDSLIANKTHKRFASVLKTYYEKNLNEAFYWENKLNKVNKKLSI